MNDPYRSEDQVSKLQAENEKLQREKDELTASFVMLMLKRWPLMAALLFGSIFLILGSYFFLGNSTKVSEHDDERLAKRISTEVVVLLSQGNLRSRVNLGTSVSPTSSLSDLPMLGMNEVGRGANGGLNGIWKFYARAGDEVVFRMEQIGGDLDPLLVLVDTQDNVLVSDDDSGEGNNATLYYHFDFSGVYTLHCGDSTGYHNEGSYTLSATRVTTR